MNSSLLKRILPIFACTFPLGTLVAACGSTDVPFGAATSASPIVPTRPTGPDGTPAGTTPGTECEFGGFAWEANPFALYPDEQACLGDQWVRFDTGLGLWVGLTVCASDETRIYLADAAEGPFAAAADTAGHGQDHCALVNAAFTLTDEDDITSGGCTDCSTGPNLPLEGLPAYARSNLGEPFAFVEVTPEWSHQVSRLRCGVALGCATPPPATPPPAPPPPAECPVFVEGAAPPGVGSGAFYDGATTVGLCFGNFKTDLATGEVVALGSRSGDQGGVSEAAELTIRGANASTPAIECNVNGIDAPDSPSCKFAALNGGNFYESSNGPFRIEVETWTAASFKGRVVGALIEKRDDRAGEVSELISSDIVVDVRAR